MRRIWGTVLVIFLALAVHSTSVVDTPEEEDARKKVADDSTTRDSKFSDEDLDETILDNLKHLFQQLKEIKDKTSDLQNKDRVNEESSTDGLTKKEVWAQILETAKAAGIDAFSTLSSDDTSANWDANNPREQVTVEPSKEEPPEPLSPEQQEAEDLFKKAQYLLNATRSYKVEAYKLLSAAATLGHKEARSMLAWAELLGTQTGYASSLAGTTQDIPAALETFKELADTGLPSAHMGIGFLYSMGLGGLNVSQAKALLHYTVAALGGDTRAEMALGYRYWAGISTTANCERALDFYRRVANKVAEQVSLSGGPVVQRVRLLDEQENPEYNSGILDYDLIEYYQLLAQRGDVQAQVGLGQLHYQGGRGVPLDHQKALGYFQHAADAGNPIAMAFLGKIYLEGSDIVQQDNETAYKYFMKAARLGNPVGQSGLGLMYLYGRGVERDTAKALRYFSQAADQGWVDGQLQLGNMYISGTGVRRDYKAANKYFNLASQSGHVLAFYNLAQMHATGTGMMRSCPTAVELLKNVAERGKWSDQLMAAHTDYREGRIDQAFITYALLAEMGYEVAQSNAAFILDRGETTILPQEEGLVTALTLWAHAAAQGYSAAQVKLGDAHYYGRGTRVDYKAAARQYRLASEQQHNAQAMFNLGYMHERGLGLTKDRHLAKRCYDLAAEANPDAKIPVALALVKLSLLSGLSYVNEFSFIEHLDKWDPNIVQNWDFYLIGILTGLLSLVIYFRRPQPPPGRAGFNVPPVN
ncbi:protein sel-1 homolog 1 isoform X2 [Venturia canescens]|uniref:protein sel-1 homolog 1 isoform X2 n=1 Tax=Venturia canescens TaxID=32260 RepID=UPI001C9C6E50|nr:protein sel-1 homolog 1 isoform X2 [Venturia canescens]